MAGSEREGMKVNEVEAIQSLSFFHLYSHRVQGDHIQALALCDSWLLCDGCCFLSAIGRLLFLRDFVLWIRKREHVSQPSWLPYFL